jgi:hypothetical protein
MSRDDLIDYHSQRAMRELDLGLTARTSIASQAHMRLSSLHLARVRVLQEESEARRAA